MHWIKTLSIALAVGAASSVFADPGKPPVFGEPDYVTPKATNPAFTQGPLVQPVEVKDITKIPYLYPSVDREPNSGLTKPGEPHYFEGEPYTPNPATSAYGIAANSLNVSFLGIGQTSLTPPDNTIAVGENNTLQAVNSTFRITDKCGNTLYENTIQSFTGHSGSFMFDPKVLFDPWRRRFFMLWHEKNGNVSNFVICTSQQASAIGSWWIYTFDAETGGGTAWADNYDVGFSANSITGSGNQFTYASNSFTTATFRTWDPSQIFTGAGAGMITDTGLTEQSGSSTFAPRCSRAMNSRGDDIFMSNRWNGGSVVTVYKINAPLGAHTITRHDIGVAAYTLPPNATQPGGSGGNGIATNDCRLEPCQLLSTANGWHIYTGSNVTSTPQPANAACRLYIFDVDAFTTTADILLWYSGASACYAAPAINYDGACNWVHTFSSSGTFASTFYVNWEPSTGYSAAAGAIQFGGNNYFGGRWGDYFDGSTDWGDYYYGGGTGGKQKMWMYGEYATSGGGWGTAVGATQTVGQSQGTMNVSPAGGMSFAGYAGSVSGSGNSYTVSNSGQVSFQWLLSGLPSYLSSDNFGNELFAPTGSSSSTVANITPNAGLQSLGYGHYTGNVTFTNCFNNAATTRPVDVQVWGRANPTAVTVKLGQQTAGNINNLTTSDGVAMRFCKAFVPNLVVPPIQVEFTSTGPAGSWGTYYFWDNSKMVTAGSFSNRTEAWNYNTGGWDTTDFATGVINSAGYSQFAIISTGNANRFRGPGNEVKGKVSIQKTGFSAVAVPCVDIDWVQWAFIAP